VNESLRSNSKRLRVGFFDSGHGGLDLLREALGRNLNIDFYYFADLDFMPYGSKDESLVSARCSKITSFFNDLKCDAVVMACNTATAASIDELRKNFKFPLIGVEPYLNYINKIEQAKDEVAAIVTPKTLESPRLKRLQNKIDPAGKIRVFAMPGLAKAIEELIHDKNWSSFETKVDDLFTVIPRQVSTLVLGCTHYPLVSSFLESRLGVKTINPAREVIDQLIRVIDAKESTDSTIDSNIFLYASNDERQWQDKSISDFIFW
jgi:glutamate racemase